MTEVEQRPVIKFLFVKKFTLNGIAAWIASVYGEQPYRKKAVEYWGDQAKPGRTTMEAKMKPGRLPLDDIEGRILACLSRESS
jgi:hypothetical protein